MLLTNTHGKDRNVCKAVDAFQPFFYELAESNNVAKARRLVRKLMDYQNTLPRNRQNITGCLVHNLKRWIEIQTLEYPDRHNRRKHKMSDHAFVRTLELLHGFDIDELKDKAISEVEGGDKFKFVYGKDNKKIVTVIPASWAAYNPPRSENH